MAISLKDHSRMFKIEWKKLKELPKPKSLFLLAMIARYDSTDDVFLSLVGLRFTTIRYRYQRHTLNSKAFRKEYEKLFNKATLYRTPLKYKASRR